ncbi:putative peroxidase [Lyophyllum shimeji]|uniref:Peroxidase n=1 Tax=Lyophyllum shimeji TaxID=47721 RepID=A0A9P3UT92_LYOSH|nr:putative peroxidase [Lyophyllum shimeji]
MIPLYLFQSFEILQVVLGIWISRRSPAVDWSKLLIPGLLVVFKAFQFEPPSRLTAPPYLPIEICIHLDHLALDEEAHLLGVLPEESAHRLADLHMEWDHPDAQVGDLLDEEGPQWAVPVAAPEWDHLQADLTDPLRVLRRGVPQGALMGQRVLHRGVPRDPGPILEYVMISRIRLERGLTIIPHRPQGPPKPPVVDPKPPVVDPKPPVVDPKPPVVDPKPPVVDPKPPVVDPKPEGPSSEYNLQNIQGDILPALPKALEYFYYFQILNVEKFREAFGKFIVPKITTAQQLTTSPPPPPPNPSVTFLGVNVGFTYLALQKFGLTDDLLDDSFVKGQQQDSKDLGDAGTSRGDFWTPNWDGEYKVEIDGIFLITAYNDAVAAKFVEDMEKAFTYTATRMSIKKVVLLKGAPRAGAEARNDHFGYRGGMSNPQVRGVTFETPAQPTIRYPGSPIIPMGVIVMGYEGDEDRDKRPAWAMDGSFMVTRKLNNLVPEFDAFLLEHGPKVFPNIPVKDAADRLGARLFGRWKDGTPTELSPDAPDPAISGDDKRINNFAFDQSAGQKRCPFASHMRKSNPRNDVTPIESVFKHFIRRHNMPYGPEVTAEERDGNGTIQQRGLHVVCYASSIVRGFKFYQQAWYNEPNFPPNKPELPGMDPIFGQTGEEHLDVHRYMTGTNPTAEQQVMSFPKKFIDPRGGEYFFAPSISTLRDLIATGVSIA